MSNPAPTCQCYVVLPAIGLSCPGPARCDASKASYCCVSGTARDFSISFYHLPPGIQRRGSDHHSSHPRPAPSSFTHPSLWNHRRSAHSDTNSAFCILIKPFFLLKPRESLKDCRNSTLETDQLTLWDKARGEWGRDGSIRQVDLVLLLLLPPARPHPLLSILPPPYPSSSQDRPTM